MMKKTVWIGIWLIAFLLCACVTRTVEVPQPSADTVVTHEPIEEAVVHETPVPATPMPTPEPTKVPTPVPTPEPTATPEPKPTPYSIVWMSDTQNLSRHYPEVFNGMRDWVLEHREEWNIVFFAHTGDVVDGCSVFMWDAATEALMPILETIPSMIASGNHDITSDNKHSLFTKRPYAQAVQKEGQTFRDGEAAYVTFEAGGDEFLVFGIGYEVRGAYLKNWIREVSAEHPDAIVLYVMHYGLQQDGRFGGQANELVHSVIAENPHARLLLCGHYRGTLKRTDWFDDDGDGEDDRSFTTMMFNYQDDRTEGLGYMRILTFDPERRTIEVRTYSPWFDQWGYSKAEPGEDAFLLEDAF